MGAARSRPRRDEARLRRQFLLHGRLLRGVGGRVIDSTYLCVADRTPGAAQALDFLRQLVVAGATPYEPSGTNIMHDDFVAGRLDAIIDGNWSAGMIASSRPATKSSCMMLVPLGSVRGCAGDDQPRGGRDAFGAGRPVRDAQVGRVDDTPTERREEAARVVQKMATKPTPPRTASRQHHVRERHPPRDTVVDGSHLG